MRKLDVVDPGRGRAAYQRWRDEALTPSLFDIGADSERFHNAFRRTWLGSMALIEFEQSGADYERTSPRTRRDGVDAIWLQTVERGGVDATSPVGDVRLRPGMAGLCDLGRTVRQRTHPGAGRIIILPREAFGAARDDLHGRTADGARHDILHDYFTWLTEAPEPSSWPDPAAIMEAVGAVVLACFQPSGPPPEAALPGLHAVALRRATAYIDAHLAEDDVSVADVARAAGVSRATLYRVAAAAGGVDALIWERRLQAARRALSDPARPGRIGPLAMEHGFKSASHFSVRFKARFGFSPRNLRPF